MTTKPSNSIRFSVFGLYKKLYVNKKQSTIVDKTNFIE